MKKESEVHHKQCLLGDVTSCDHSLCALDEETKLKLLDDYKKWSTPEAQRKVRNGIACKDHVGARMGCCNCVFFHSSVPEQMMNEIEEFFARKIEENG